MAAVGAMGDREARGKARARATGAAGAPPPVRRPRGDSAPAETLAELSAAGRPLAGLTRADVERMVAAAGSTSELDLRGADLRHADLSDLDLSGAHLERARLDGARLIAANLQEAQLQHAQLEAADLRGAILSGARLDGADLSGAHLDGASLQGAYLTFAHLAHARLDGAHLRGAHLEDATLWGASLSGAELDGCHFSGADLHDTDLDGAFFAGCALADADIALIRWEPLRAGEELAARRAVLGERPEMFRAAADAYRRLRQACAAQGLYERAGELYRREMRMRQRSLGFETLLAVMRTPVLRQVTRAAIVVAVAAVVLLKRPLEALSKPLGPAPRLGRGAFAALRAAWLSATRLLRPASGWAWHVALEALCGYGERVGRVLIAAAILMVGMALVYLRLGQLTEPDGSTVTSFWHALYFSACSFSSIGYAAFAPNAHGLAKWLGVAESFSGNFLLALFLVTFTRKLTR
jgi:uncharacterized protein YjbI with pentapeptide repeats